MSCNIYEKPRFNLAEQRQADGDERQVCRVELYESADGLNVCQGYFDPRNEGAPVQRPFFDSQKNWFRPAILLLALLSFLLLLAVVILSALYVDATKERDMPGQNLERLPGDQTLCQRGGDKVMARSHTDWRRSGCSCYYRSNEKKSWTESRRLCQNSGGDLVSINNKQESDFVKSLNENRNSWIGLHQNRKDKWEWVDGTQLSYIRTRDGWRFKPNETHAFINAEGFLDTVNTGSKYWICEKTI